MKVFVTGGTGFIGHRLVQRLVERGDQVYALVRSEAGAADLRTAGALPVMGDITDRESMREGMLGSDLVFHTAGWYKLGSTDRSMAEAINVAGTRNVLGLAHELGIPKIVYTSTVAVYGDTGGRLAEERDPIPDGPFLTEYDRTKWQAHVQVALPLIREGAPIIIVMPGAVFGPGDHSLVGEMMRRYFLGQFPVFPAPELTLTFAHVDDIVEGHLLAAEKGRIGESYFLAGPALRLSEMARMWSEVTGKPEPIFSLPARLLKPFAPVMGAAGRVLPLPELVSRDSLVILDATYGARSEKARQELGWRTRPLREGMKDTFATIAAETGKSEPGPRRRRRAAGLAVFVSLSLLYLWLRRRK